VNVSLLLRAATDISVDCGMQEVVCQMQHLYQVCS